ncbi:MAG: NfeD family protein [Ignavibacteria bacterium]|nr:NfeD family protein [Ignavibacteria bacterium]
MTDSQIWLIIAIAFLILEIITPGFVLANFAVGAIGAAVAAFFGATMVVQLIVFAILCFISFVTIRPILKKTLIKDDKPAFLTGAGAIVGRTTIVTERIPNDLISGRVQIDGDSWQAISEDANPIEVGERVSVVRVDSTIVVVKRL